MARKGWFTMGREELPPSRKGETATTEDTYNYLKEGSTESWRGKNLPESHMEMAVEHKPPVNQYVYPGQPYGSKYNRAMTDLAEPDPRTGTPKMFGMQSTPGVSKVHYMSGTREARVMAPTLLGIAQNRTQQDFGRSLEASPNLSEHSHRLVSHLAEAGVVEAPDVASNDMTFQPHAFPLYGDERTEVIPEEQVRKGRRTIRRMLVTKRG